MNVIPGKKRVLVVLAGAHQRQRAIVQLRSLVHVTTVSSVNAAIEFLKEHGERPLIFDLESADGLGLDVLRRVRLLDPTIEALLLGNAARRSIAEKHKVQFARAPLSTETVTAFVNEVDANDRARRDRIVRVLETWSTNYKLTRAERSLIYAMAVDGISRQRLAEALGKRKDTVKAQVRSVLKKTGRPSITQAVVALLRAALR